MRRNVVLAILLTLVFPTFKVEAASISGSVEVAPLEDNITLNAFHRVKDNTLSIQNMVDGIVDGYSDQAGIDTGASENFTYNGTLNMYAPDATVSLTELLLHLNGTDASTTFTDSSLSGHSFSNGGSGAELDTAEKKFGTASLLLDGTNDYISASDSPDWDLLGNNTDSWTVDFWAKTNSNTSQQFVSQYQDINNFWYIYRIADGTLQFASRASGATVFDCRSEPSVYVNSEWSHIAVIIQGDGSTKKVGVYFNGTQKIYCEDNTNVTFNGTLYIGKLGNDEGYFSGHLDEINWVKGNPFNAFPNAPTIQVPTSEQGTINGVLVSGTFTAQEDPEQGRITLFEEDIDAVTLNTDIKAFLSRDGGETFLEVPLIDRGEYESDKRVLSGLVNFSNLPSGSLMQYKVETLNQKEMNLHGVGLGWR